MDHLHDRSALPIPAVAIAVVRGRYAPSPDGSCSLAFLRWVKTWGNKHPFTSYDLGYHPRTRVLSHNHSHVFGVCHSLGFALVTSWWVSIRIFSHSSPPLMAQVWNVQLAPGARQNLPVALSVQQGAGVTMAGGTLGWKISQPTTQPH